MKIPFNKFKITIVFIFLFGFFTRSSLNSCRNVFTSTNVEVFSLPRGHNLWCKLGGHDRWSCVRYVITTYSCLVHDDMAVLKRIIEMIKMIRRNRAINTVAGLLTRGRRRVSMFCAPIYTLNV